MDRTAPSVSPPSTRPLSRYQKPHLGSPLGISAAASTPAPSGESFEIDLDLPEEDAAEDRRLRCQRLESLGALAGGIAHDLNNILAPISMCLETLREECPPHLDEDLDTLKASVERGAKLVRQVLTFARGMDGRPQEIDPNELLDELRDLLEQTLPAVMEIEVGGLAVPWAVIADPTGLHQVLLNLCVNARDATDGAGSLRVSASAVTVTEERCLAVGCLPPGDYVVFTVEDDGPGMSAEVQERIFEPFFTTKDIGTGTGLGLSTSASIVTSHGGGIGLRSTVGEGSEFRVFLPARPTTSMAVGRRTSSTTTRGVRSTRAARFPEPTEPTEPVGDDGDAAVATATASPPRPTVLVVDDEARIRKMFCRILESLGYAALQAAGGREALATYEDAAAEIGVVITDLAMPEMDGYELVQCLKSRSPGLAVVVTSGLADSARIDDLRELGIDRFLSKPFSRTDLAGVLREVGPEKARVTAE